MNHLVNSIADKTGISEDKALEVLQTISKFIKERYPLLANTVDSVLETDKREDSDSK